jgi:hypothetical protein
MIVPFHSRIARTAAVALVLGAAPGVGQPADVRVRQLSPEGSPSTNVQVAAGTRAISPDGKWVVFYADVATNGVPEIYSVRRFGGTPVRLSAFRPGVGSAAPAEITISPDSRRVLYRLDDETAGRRELWSVPIQGPATAAVKLNPDEPAANVAQAPPRFSADGQYVAFEFHEGFPEGEVWTAPVDGSAPAVRVTPAPGEGSFTDDVLYGAERVVFLASFVEGAALELWSAPYDGSAAATRISGTLAPGGSISSFALSPDGRQVAYRGSQRFPGVVELFTVPAAGPFSAAKRISPDLATDTDVEQFEFSENGARVLFTIAGAEPTELWSAPIAGTSADADPISGPLPSYVQFPLFETGGQVAYRVGIDGTQYELHLAPTVGPPSAARVISEEPVAGGGLFSGRLHRSGATLYALASGRLRDVDQREYYAAPVAGITTVQPLFAAIPTGGLAVLCTAGRAGAVLVFCAETGGDGVVRLFRAPLDLGAPPEQINEGVAAANNDVTDLEVDPRGQWVAFRWDGGLDERYDLYRARVDGAGSPQRLHALPASNSADVPAGDSFDWTPDGFGVVYVADHDVFGKRELWIADAMVFRADFEGGGTGEWSAVSP